MKRFCIKVVLFFCALAVILGVSCFTLPLKTAKSSLLTVQRSKLIRLQEIKGPRVILVGGSGLGQGMATADFAAQIKRPVYNMGVHAGLGLVYQMSAVLPLLHQGDLVVLVPEYANFQGLHCYGDMELISLLVDILPEQRNYITIGHWMRLSDLILQYGAIKLRNLFVSRGPDRNPSGWYDDFGDQFWPRNCDAAEHRSLPPAKVLSSSDFTPDILFVINDFCSQANEKGTRVVLLPPAYLKSDYVRQREFIQAAAAALAQNGTPFIAPPERYALKDHYFFDTHYHLNLAGRKVRSGLMAEDIFRDFEKKDANRQ